MSLLRDFSEVYSSLIPLVGPAPVGAKFGFDSVTGVFYYNNAGTWAVVPFSGAAKPYVAAMKTANQAVLANIVTDVSFDNIYSNGITFNPGPSTFSLLANQTYKIFAVARMENAIGIGASLMQFQWRTVANVNLYLLNPAGFADSQISTTGTNGPMTLFHYTPLVNTDVKMVLNFTRNADISAAGTFATIEQVP